MYATISNIVNEQISKQTIMLLWIDLLQCMEPNVADWCCEGLNDAFHVTVALQDLKKQPNSAGECGEGRGLVRSCHECFWIRVPSNFSSSLSSSSSLPNILLFFSIVNKPFLSLLFLCFFSPFSNAECVSVVWFI